MSVETRWAGRGESPRRAGRGTGALADAWASWVAELTEWQLTATLTFDPKRRPVVPPGPQRGRRIQTTPWPVRTAEDGRLVAPLLTRDVAERFVKRWLRQAERAFGARLTAICALEYHKSGAPHFHALLTKTEPFNVVQVQFLGDLWRELAGFCRLEEPRNVADCAAYASKYLTKDLDRGTVLLWPSGGPLVRGELLPIGGGTGAGGGPA